MASITTRSSFLGYTWRWDRRNDPIEPTRGFDMSISQDFAGIGGDVQYLRTEATAAWYRGLWGGLRFSSRFSTGHITPLGDDTVRINNRFFRGGSSFRGFDVAGLGPREVIRVFNDDNTEFDLNSGSALGGNVYYQGTFELSVPNLLPEEYGIKTALFTDAGSLGQLEDEDSNEPIFFVTTGIDGLTRNAVQFTEDELSLRAAAGLSVFWDSPFGPIRFDFSEILRKEDYDRTETFRFSTSTRF
ncbi:MAG: BamA/TamA family outer membrane protein [Pseudomonadota bacterium]